MFNLRRRLACTFNRYALVTLASVITFLFGLLVVKSCGMPIRWSIGD